MLGEIDIVNKSNYVFEYSNTVKRNSISLRISNENKAKTDQIKTDFFAPSTKDKNITYTQTGKIIDVNNKYKNNESSSTDSSLSINKTVVTSTGKELKPEEKKQVEELKRIDSNVKAHEQAHMSAGGSLVRGGANYQYVKGPDGQLYAVGGEVQIDISPIADNPSATIAKMEQVKRSALAPADPSGQDKQVAGIANQIESQALQEEQQKPTENVEKTNKSTNNHNVSVTKLDTNYIQKFFKSSNLHNSSKFSNVVS